MDRREFLVASAAAAAMVPLGASALPTHNCFDHCGDGCKGLCASAYSSWTQHAWDLTARYPDIKFIWPNHMLKEAWTITEGKEPTAMAAALTERFGQFPIWFIDHRSEVVILGVGNLSAEVLDKSRPDILKGYLLCDTRIIRVCQDGVWEERDTLDND